MFKNKNKEKDKKPNGSSVKTSTTVVTSGNTVRTTTVTRSHYTWSQSTGNQISTITREQLQGSNSQIPPFRLRPQNRPTIFDAQPYRQPVSSPSTSTTSPSRLTSPRQTTTNFNFNSGQPSYTPSRFARPSNLNYTPVYSRPYDPRRNSEYLADKDRVHLSPSSSLSALNESKKIIPIKVTKSIKFLDNIGKIPVYKTRSKNRGKVLIINNIIFKDATKNRDGAEVDQANLLGLFKELGKWKVVTEKNLSAAGIRNKITSYTKTPDKKYDINAVIIMSHGTGEETSDSTKIVGVDGELVPIHWILEQFSNFMEGKPKIFIFQCCRGDKRSTVSTIKTDSNRALSDMLVAYATVPGFVSHRDTQKGTWYIQLFCQTVMEHAHDTDIEGILKIVDAGLSNLESSFNTKQTSNYENRGFRRCYLHPGLWE